MAPFDAVGFQVETKPQIVAEPWRKVLMDAADYIEAHGWCQHSVATDDGRACLNGAIKIAGGMNPQASNWRDYPAVIIATEAMRSRVGLPDQYFAGHRDATLWNDTPGRTAAEVCNALRECARAS